MIEHLAIKIVAWAIVIGFGIMILNFIILIIDAIVSAVRDSKDPFLKG